MRAEVNLFTGTHDRLQAPKVIQPHDEPLHQPIGVNEGSTDRADWRRSRLRPCPRLRAASPCCTVALLAFQLQILDSGLDRTLTHTHTAHVERITTRQLTLYDRIHGTGFLTESAVDALGHIDICSPSHPSVNRRPEQEKSLTRRLTLTVFCCPSRTVHARLAFNRDSLRRTNSFTQLAGYGGNGRESADVNRARRHQ